MFPYLKDAINLLYIVSLLFILQVLETVVNGIENMGGERLLLLLFSHVLKCTLHTYCMNCLFILMDVCTMHVSEAFCSMMTGGNIGKQVVKISD